MDFSMYDPDQWWDFDALPDDSVHHDHTATGRDQIYAQNSEGLFPKYFSEQGSCISSFQFSSKKAIASGQSSPSDDANEPKIAQNCQVPLQGSCSISVNDVDRGYDIKSHPTTESVMDICSRTRPPIAVQNASCQHPITEASSGVEKHSFEQHKDELHLHYLALDKPLKVVREFMLKTHGIKASEAQYLRQFKKWKFRKNLKDQEWKYIHHRVKKRKELGKDSVVLVDGITVEPQKVRKEIGRHCESCKRYISGLPPKTPEGILVCTPKVPRLTTNVDNLPWFQGPDFRDPPLRSTSCIKAVRLPLISEISQVLTLLYNSEDPPPPIMTTLLQTLLPERHEGEVAARIDRLSGPDWHASTEEFLHICIFLISNNMDNDKLRQTLVSYLADPSNKGVLSSLLSLEGTTMQMFKERLLIMAVSNDNSQLVIELLRRNTNPNIRNVESGQTALQSCVLNGNIELCRVLLAAGADVNAEPAPARLDGTALQMAARQLRLDIILLLLEYRADVNATGNADKTALEIAVLWPLVSPNVELCSTSTIVQALLSAGTSLSGKGYPHTSSSLSEALNRDLRPIVRVLLESSTDLGTIVADGLGRTLLQKALETKNIDLVAEVWGYGSIDSQLICRAMEDLKNPNSFLDFCGVTALARLEELYDSDTIMVMAYEAALLFEPQKAREFWTRTCSNLIKGGNLNSFLAMLVVAHRKGQDMVPGLDLARIGVLEDLDDRSKFAMQAAVRLTNGPAATCLKNTICHQPRKKTPEWSDILASVETIQSCSIHGNSRWLNISLSIAVCIDNLDLVKDFILKGADVNASVKSGGCSTALYEAVNIRSLQAIEGIIFSRGDRSTTFEQPKTLLQVASTNKNTELVKCLIAAGADIDADVGYSPLNISFHNGDAPTFEVLVDAGADLKSLTDGFWPRTTIFSASERRDFTNMFNMLINRDLVLAKTAVGNWLLHEAAVSGDLKLMKWLVHAGAKVNTLGGPGQVPSTLLQKVIARKPQKKTVSPGSPRVIKNMLSGLLDKPLADAPLEQGAHQTSTDMVKLLVEAGADINAFYWENENSNSDVTFKPKNIFQLAASNGNLEIMRFLFDAGSDMNALPAASGGRTALQAAAEKGHGHIVKFLMDAGADVNEGPAEFGGRTALQLVASKGFLGLAIVLLEAGADPNADDDIILGMTALECAVKHGRLDTVKLLLDNGARMKTRSCRTAYPRALKFAETNGHSAIVKMLRQQG